MDDAAKVKFLVRPDAWAAFVALEPEAEAAVADALTVYGNPYLAAAYILERLCAQPEPVQGSGATALKELKVGELQFKFADDAAQSAADHWCTLAIQLRKQAQGSGLSIQWSSPLHVAAQEREC